MPSCILRSHPALFLLGIAMLLAASNAPAAGDEGTAGGPTLIARARRTSGPIRIDGMLDEESWRAAESITTLTQRQPAEGEPATQPTEVRILYDDERLFIGAELFDSEPARIIAREMKEDGDLDRDDLFGVLLDTFHDRRNGFYFAANPNGARSDALVYDEGRITSFDWDGVWEVSSRVTGRGWTVEMEIPFKTLHFDPEKTNPWGLQIWRFIRRENEDAYWAPVPRNEDLYRISRAGELHGLEGIRQGASFAVKPYALGGITRRPTFGETAADGRGEIGLDARYDLTPNLAAVATLNTDFAETEVDDQQVNITRFSLFFPEKREFFLESTGYFSFGFNRTGPGAPPGVIPFFSRRVGLDAATGTPVPILGGVKLAGRLGRYNLGFLSVNTDEDGRTPQTNYSVARVSRDILTRSNWGVMGISKEPAGPDRIADPNDPADDVHSNRTYGVDLNFSTLENLKFGGSLLATRTPGASGGQGAGHAYAFWSDNRWEIQFSYRDLGSGFNPEAGFVRRTGIEEGEGFLGWSWRSDTAPVRRVEPHTRHIYTMDQDHHLATRFQHWATSVEFRDGSEIEVGWNPTFDEVTAAFSLDDGVEVRPGAYSMNQWLFRYGGDASRRMSVFLFADFGDFFDGDFYNINANLLARLSKHFRSTLGVTRAEIDLPSRPDDPGTPAFDRLPSSEFRFTLAQARLGVTLTTRVTFDALLQYNTAVDDFSSNLRFNYKYRPGSDIYVVYNERRDTEGMPADAADRSFTVKWAYLMAF